MITEHHKDGAALLFMRQPYRNEKPDMSARTDAADWALYSNLNYIKTGNFTIAAGRILGAADGVTFSNARIQNASRVLSNNYGFSPKLAHSIASDVIAELRRG